jgi:two-component system, chemotaxis family, sensor kinase CheA
VTLCHLTENLFDRLRNGELELTPELMDVIMAATKGVREMFGELGQMVMPQPADAHVIAALKGALEWQPPSCGASGGPCRLSAPVAPIHATAAVSGSGEPDWHALHATLTGAAVPPAAEGELIAKEAAGRQVLPPRRQQHWPRRQCRGAVAVRAAGNRPSWRPADQCPAGGRARHAREHHPRRYLAPGSGAQPFGRDRPDQEPLDQPACDILAGKNDSETLHALDQAVSQLDLLVSDLQNSVMKTRMQPIGRLFQKYPRIARDWRGSWARMSNWCWPVRRPKSTRR